MNIEIHDWWEVSVVDYHLFKNVQFYYKQAGLKTKYEEVGWDGDYIAIFWMVGSKKPIEHIKQVKKQLEK